MTLILAEPDAPGRGAFRGNFTAVSAVPLGRKKEPLGCDGGPGMF
jgi:hypothetical protein